MEIPEINPGQSLRVTTKVKEGSKERLQNFDGIVISTRGRGVSKTFTVRRIGAAGIGVERIWPYNSPSIAKIEVKASPKVRRAKLFYLRDRIGKAATKL
jgi:large subunit ribosomal protein L19